MVFNSRGLEYSVGIGKFAKNQYYGVARIDGGLKSMEKVNRIEFRIECEN